MQYETVSIKLLTNFFTKKDNSFSFNSDSSIWSIDENKLLKMINVFHC